MTGAQEDKHEDCWLIEWILVVAIIILAIFCFVIRNSSPSFKAPATPAGAYIPTVFELQTALCNAGYTVEVDCEVGDETKAAWNAYCADREAKKYFTKTGEPK